MAAWVSIILLLGTYNGVRNTHGRATKILPASDTHYHTFVLRCLLMWSRQFQIWLVLYTFESFVEHPSTQLKARLRQFHQRTVYSLFLVWVRSSNMCSPQRAGKRTYKNYEHPKMFGYHRLYNGFNHFHMQNSKKRPIRISTRSRLVLKCPGARKFASGFRVLLANINQMPYFGRALRGVPNTEN